VSCQPDTLSEFELLAGSNILRLHHPVTEARCAVSRHQKQPLQVARLSGFVCVQVVQKLAGSRCRTRSCMVPCQLPDPRANPLPQRCLRALVWAKTARELENAEAFRSSTSDVSSGYRVGRWFVTWQTWLASSETRMQSAMQGHHQTKSVLPYCLVSVSYAANTFQTPASPNSDMRATWCP
jgi:hypothetical protein